jgi:PKD repeat protein
MKRNSIISKMLVLLVLMSITVVPAAAVKFPGCANDAKDIDRDGLCEDINGNGLLDFDDVVVFFNSIGNVRFWGANFFEINHFNFDGKWAFMPNYNDVVALYNKL